MQRRIFIGPAYGFMERGKDLKMVVPFLIIAVRASLCGRMSIFERKYSFAIPVEFRTKPAGFQSVNSLARIAGTMVGNMAENSFFNIYLYSVVLFKLFYCSFKCAFDFRRFNGFEFKNRAAA